MLPNRCHTFPSVCISYRYSSGPLVESSSTIALSVPRDSPFDFPDASEATTSFNPQLYLSATRFVSKSHQSLPNHVQRRNRALLTSRTMDVGLEVALTQQCRGRETTGVPVSVQVDLMASIFNIYHQSSA